MINVALERVFLELLEESRNHSRASSKVVVMRAKVLKVFPIPISSASIPPPNSLGGSVDSALVSLCRYLWLPNQNYLTLEFNIVDLQWSDDVAFVLPETEFR